MLIIIISRSSLKLDHVGSKTRLLGHQATQVSDLGPLWPSCFNFNWGFARKLKGDFFLFWHFSVRYNVSFIKIIRISMPHRLTVFFLAFLAHLSTKCSW